MSKLFMPTVLLWLFVNASAAPSPNEIQVIYAVNVCGQRVTVNGTTYEADPNGFDSYDCSGDSWYRTDATLHTNYRAAAKFDFYLPKATNGHYVLRFGQGDAYARQFDVFLNGRHKLTSANNYFQVIDGLLKYKDENSYVSGSVALNFVGHPNNAATVASILLVKGELADLKAAKFASDSEGAETEFRSKVLEQLSQILTTLKEQNELIKSKVN